MATQVHKCSMGVLAIISMSMESTQREIFLRYTTILSVNKEHPASYVETMPMRRIPVRYRNCTENYLSRMNSMSHITHSRTPLNLGQLNG